MDKFIFKPVVISGIFIVEGVCCTLVGHFMVFTKYFCFSVILLLMFLFQFMWISVTMCVVE